MAGSCSLRLSVLAVVVLGSVALGPAQPVADMKSLVGKWTGNEATCPWERI
jgi:hypothetical protein